MTDERAKVTPEEWARELVGRIRPALTREELAGRMAEIAKDVAPLSAVVMLSDAADLARRGLWRTAIDAARQAIVVMEAQA